MFLVFLTESIILIKLSSWWGFDTSKFLNNVMLPYFNSTVNFSATINLYVSLYYIWGHPCTFRVPVSFIGRYWSILVIKTGINSTIVLSECNKPFWNSGPNPTQRHPIHINYYFKFITLLGDTPARFSCQLWP